MGEVKWATPGAAGGLAVLDRFLTAKLKLFDAKRNDPTVDALSNTSPWMHFGQIAPQRCALEAKRRAGSHTKARDGFLEELIVRREVRISRRSPPLSALSPPFCTAKA